METRSKTRALAILAAGGTAAVAIALAGGPEGLGGPEDAGASALEPFASCDEILEYADEHSWARNAYPYAISEDTAIAPAAMAANSSARAVVPESGAVGPGETGTNVQEAGIDEPDIAKLSGSTLFAIHRKTLSAYDVSGDEAVLLDELDLELDRAAGEANLLVAGDTALVTSSGYESTVVTELDVSDPTAITATRELQLEGTQVSARLQGTTARLVIESQPDYPGLEGNSPAPDPLPEEEPATGATGESGPLPEEDEDEPGWLPQASLIDLETEERATSPLIDCSEVSYPERFSGLGILSVLTLDLESGLEPADVDAVMTDGSTVYASAESLYVATSTLTPPRDGVVEEIGRVIAPDTTMPAPGVSGETEIHRFAVSEEPATEYAASGSVRGRLIGQFAMSESEGALRVASTEGDAWAEGPGESESMITVLNEEDGALVETGRVGGLGRGEEIYAVRFIGDMGYVVTFEQTDPLYTVDLSDPANPETTGELKIPGYSAYLHPVADGRLLGIGQDGTMTGGVTGAQASLFDVSDPARPDRIDQQSLSDGRYSSSATEWDHHAFLYAPEHALAVIPVSGYGRDSLRGAVALQVDPGAGMTVVARLEDESQIQRMLVAGENLVTVSTRGVAVRAIDEL